MISKNSLKNKLPNLNSARNHRPDANPNPFSVLKDGRAKIRPLCHLIRRKEQTIKTSRHSSYQEVAGNVQTEQKEAGGATPTFKNRKLHNGFKSMHKKETKLLMKTRSCLIKPRSYRKEEEPIEISFGHISKFKNVFK